MTRTPTVAARTAGPGQRLTLLRRMLLIRRFEERCVELYSAARIRGFMHLYIGEEAVATGVMAALTPDDAVVSTYREHGHALARGVSADAVMAEMFGRVDGCSRGRGGSMHLFDAGARFYGGNAIVGGGLPIAVGLALADALTGRHAVTACFFGDGAVAEGEFHECLNLAALWRLPVLFCCENNQYAMGTALDRAQAVTDLAHRAGSYGMTARAVDGMDVEAVVQAARQAVRAVRGGHGPRFLELQTYRFRAHSMYDSDRYRDKAEIARWKLRDPIELLCARMRGDGQLEAADLAGLDAAVTADVDAAVAFAERSPAEPVTDLTRFVHSERRGTR
ncbi:pyruvate dehydrogenase (acetyl-transferring) E1 component subunit alpha [Spirilliplanes yamanashiensis]|uniref:Pyruvate dehydrogenase E1 component subunit alpha n=1 Tax=Spirilliplanes yamanashiensis TaxID=42233 RepID=A0A8J4DLS8_9ACTN|nr:pyruvate dehydrogenase (acetyl-transferring) E1 component subunit alpha [Spirilliplanes yamanashiensis]MDP9818301.1 pyruvate dehydrogenase E1 component alpha subunit [Spirilliplanes yamanashiensis]GIJ06717.1 pyruvate dehydrogenase E1 component subunit alpha [Spirilliplanes yamanashiensis]